MANESDYHSGFTGQQVEEAIEQVLNNYEAWSNKADPESVAVVAQAVASLQSAMNGKADLTTIFGAKRLNMNQVPLAFITYRNASATFPGGPDENNVTWLRHTDNQYRICYHNNGEDVVLGAPQNMLYYSGNGIYKWSGSQFQKIVDLTDYFSAGKLKMSALPDNLPSGSGLSDDIYTAIKDNIEILRSILYTLIKTWLANLAFLDGRPTDQTLSVIANAFNNWPTNDGGEDAQEPTLLQPANDGGIANIGTASGGTITAYISVLGIYLNESLNVSVQGTGFSVSPTSITPSQASAGTNIAVTYSSVSLNAATGTLIISSGEVSRTVYLQVAAGGGATQTFVITQTLTGCTSSYLGGTVTEGTTLTIVLTPNSGRTFTGGTISATMNNDAVEVTNGSNGTKVISFGAVTGTIVITATAVAEQPTPSSEYIQTDLVLHLDGKNRGNSSGHWIDTIGNRDFVLNEACVEDPEVTFDALDITKEFSGVKFEQVNNVYAAGMYTIPSGTTDPVHINSINNDYWTIEVVFTPIGSQWWGVNHGFFAQCDTTASSAYGLLCAVFQSVSSGKKMVFSSANSSKNIRRDVTSLVTEQAGEPFAQGCLMRVSQNKDALVVNGSQVNVELNAGTIGYDMISGGPQAMRIGMLLNSFGGNDSAKAVIHEIRVYTSRLTVAQMQANQAIDLQRYGGN